MYHILLGNLWLLLLYPIVLSLYVALSYVKVIYYPSFEPLTND